MMGLVSTSRGGFLSWAQLVHNSLYPVIGYKCLPPIQQVYILLLFTYSFFFFITHFAISFEGKEALFFFFFLLKHS